jgi:D-methionine transport system permease protein
MSNALLNVIWLGFQQTVTMVSFSSLFTVLFGIPLGVILATTSSGGIYEAPMVYRVLGAVVNAVRSVPFIILLVAIIPFTRLLTGTTIGVWAAIVPLSVGGIPYYARVAEVSFMEVDRGLIEAVQSMGAGRWFIVTNVLLPEALPGMLAGITLTIIGLLASSAVAGAVGAGGLGDVAIRYGYQRFDTTLTLIIVVMLIVLVSIIQKAGDLLVRRFNKKL